MYVFFKVQVATVVAVDLATRGAIVFVKKRSNSECIDNQHRYKSGSP